MSVKNPTTERTSLAPRTADRHQLTGLLDGFTATTLQSRGLLEILSLERVAQPKANPSGYANPTESLKLVRVPTYGEVVLENESKTHPMIVPMHIGFFQHGAQNHATSRTLLLEAGEELHTKDAFCIQEAQGGLLQEADQRFLMLPLELRPIALGYRTQEDFSRLWSDIHQYTRRFGIDRGGHLERFFRPYFTRLQPFRHAFEPLSTQSGAAWFIGGQLAGVELGPSPEWFRDLFAIYSIYCYGPSVLLAERNEVEPVDTTVDLSNLISLEHLQQRLQESRELQKRNCVNQLEELTTSKWKQTTEEEKLGLKLTTIARPGWVGQVVTEGNTPVYVSFIKQAV